MRGGASVQDSAEEQRGEELCGRDGLSIRLPAGGTHTKQNPYGCLRNTHTSPLPPFFLFYLGLFFLAFSIGPPKKPRSCCKSQKFLQVEK